MAAAAAGYWERAEFPVELARGYGRLGIAGGSIVGNGCPGVSFLAEGVIAAELARGDGSIATLNAVHSGLAMTTIAMLGSEEQQAQYLLRMATCEILGAFALTEPKHGSDVVALGTRQSRDVRFVQPCCNPFATTGRGHSYLRSFDSYRDTDAGVKSSSRALTYRALGGA